MKKLSASLIALSTLLVFFACKKHDDNGCHYKLTVNGYAGDCDGQPVNGTVSIQLDGSSYTGKIAKGAYSVTITRCSVTPTPIKVTVQDTATRISSTQDVQNDSSSHLVDTGTFTMDTLTACALDQWFVILGAGGGVGVGSPANGTITYTANATQTKIDADGYADESASLSFGPISAAGTYPIGFVDEDISHDVTGGSNGTVTVTSYGPVGGYVTGTFSAQIRHYDGGFYYGDTTTLYPATGSFQVKRTQ